MKQFVMQMKMNECAFFSNQLVDWHLYDDNSTCLLITNNQSNRNCQCQNNRKKNYFSQPKFYNNRIWWLITSFKRKKNSILNRRSIIISNAEFMCVCVQVVCISWWVFFFFFDWILTFEQNITILTVSSMNNLDDEFLNLFFLAAELVKLNFFRLYFKVIIFLIIDICVQVQ